MRCKLSLEKMPFPVRKKKESWRMVIWLEATTVKRANIGFTWNIGFFGGACSGVIYGVWRLQYTDMTTLCRHWPLTAWRAPVGDFRNALCKIVLSLANCKTKPIMGVGSGARLPGLRPKQIQRLTSFITSFKFHSPSGFLSVKWIIL